MINEINVKEYATLAIKCIEALKYIKLTEQEQYLIGREIEKQSGVYYEIPSKLGEKL